MMIEGSFHGTRTKGIVDVVEIACSIGTAVPKSVAPCCVSTQSQSKPWCAITSALMLLGMLSQPPIWGLPASRFCLTVFGRMRVPPLLSERA